jgi:hypothetical protein
LTTHKTLSAFAKKAKEVQTKNMKIRFFLLSFIASLTLSAQADPIKTLVKKGYSKAAADLKYCGEDYNAAASIWTLTEKDKLVLCVSPDQSQKEAQKQKVLQVGRNVLPLMSEFVLVAKNKATSVCTNDEVREVDCAAFIGDKKIEVMITHKKMPGLQSVSLIECTDDGCEKKKGCSSQIPISGDFRKHKLKSFLKKITDHGLIIKKQTECVKADPKCKIKETPSLKEYTIDEQIVLVRLALKEDNTDAEQVLNWFTLGLNCKEDCISADDFFEDRECRKK